MQLSCNERHDLVAIHFGAQLVNNDHAVGISVKGNADIGAGLNDGGFQTVRGRRPDAGIDVQPIRPVPDDCQVRSEAAQGGRADLKGSAMSAIQDDLEAGEINVRTHGFKAAFKI